MRILADTNVFVRAIYKEKDYEKCAKLLSDPELQIVASSMTFAEIFPIMRKFEDATNEAVAEIENIIGPNTVPTTKDLAKIAGNLLVKYKFGIADAIILASALLTGCDALATTDSDFDSVDEIKILKF